MNVKEVVIKKMEVSEVELDATMTPELREEGTVRELLRMIQEARKNAGLEHQDSASLTIATDTETQTLIEKNRESIMRITRLSALTFGSVEGEAGKLGEAAITLAVARV